MLISRFLNCIFLHFAIPHANHSSRLRHLDGPLLNLNLGHLCILHAVILHLLFTFGLGHPPSNWLNEMREIPTHRLFEAISTGCLDGLLDHNWAWYFHQQLHRIVFNPFNFVDLSYLHRAKDIEVVGMQKLVHSKNKKKQEQSTTTLQKLQMQKCHKSRREENHARSVAKWLLAHGLPAQCAAPLAHPQSPCKV